MMKSFQQFITEAESGKRYHAHRSYDPDVQGRSQFRTQGEGGRVKTYRKKTEPEKRRTKAVGGGKTAPAKDYKPRKDIGTQRPKSRKEEQPTRERGSAKLTPREQQRKAAMERRAAKSSGKSKKDLEKAATQLLTKKTTKAVDPNYKPRKASGLTTKERKALYKKGERTLRDIRLKNLGKKSEKELKHKITSK